MKGVDWGRLDEIVLFVATAALILFLASTAEAPGEAWAIVGMLAAGVVRTLKRGNGKEEPKNEQPS